MQKMTYISLKMVEVVILSFAQLVTTFIAFSAWDKSCVKWYNSRNSIKKMRTTVKRIIDYCPNLLEVNFGLTLLSDNSINYIINNITPGILKLGLYSNKVKDEHIETLVTRCKNLTSLDLRECDISDKSLNSLIQHIKLEELNVCDCSISFTKILELKSMPRLKTLVYLVSANSMAGLRYFLS